MILLKLAYGLIDVCPNQASPRSKALAIAVQISVAAGKRTVGPYANHFLRGGPRPVGPPSDNHQHQLRTGRATLAEQTRTGRIVCMLFLLTAMACTSPGAPVAHGVEMRDQCHLNLYYEYRGHHPPHAYMDYSTTDVFVFVFVVYAGRSPSIGQCAQDASFVRYVLINILANFEVSANNF